MKMQRILAPMAMLAVLGTAGCSHTACRRPTVVAAAPQYCPPGAAAPVYVDPVQTPPPPTGTFAPPPANIGAPR